MFEIRNLTKEYKNKLILNDLNYEFIEGNIYIIKGDNGSGKSTLFKIIAGIINKDKGYITGNKLINFLPEKYHLTKLIKAKSFLKDHINNLDIDSVMKRYELDNKIISNLSKGNLQKIGIIKTIYLDSDIYILDEAFDGIDNNIKNILIDDLLSLKNQKKIIILSNHENINLDKLSPIYLNLRNGKIEI